MASQHDSVSSDQNETTKVENIADHGDDIVTSEGDTGLSTTGESADDDVEDGFDVETHGGGGLEIVDDFDPMHAMTEGFGSETVEVPEELVELPRSCDLEFTDEQESVCGRDDRKRINNTANIPWRMICQLIITRQDNRQSRCTGWFIGPRTVMTAGHCVYSHSAGGWARSIEVVPGMNASARPFGSATGTSFRSVRGWTQDQKTEYDYGAIILPSGSLGRSVGWFGFARLSDASLKNLLVNNAGYPGDKPFGTHWYSAGRITRITARRLFYMHDTAGGQSGCPTWRFKDGKRHAVGIHAYGGCPNKSTRINKSVYDNMKTWKALGF